MKYVFYILMVLCFCLGIVFPDPKDRSYTMFIVANILWVGAAILERLDKKEE